MTANYRDDPDWQAAQRRYIGDDSSGDEPADGRLVASIFAAIDMHRIETASASASHSEAGGGRAT